MTFPIQTTKAALTVTALLLVGCNSATPSASVLENSSEAQTANGSGSQTLQGLLVSNNSGAAVAGSKITVDGTKINATTDAQGRFALKLNPGTYNLSFAKKGYAASRVEGVVVVSGANPTLNVIQKVAFGDNLPTVAPSAKLFTTTASVGADGSVTYNNAAEFLGGDLNAADTPVWNVEAKANGESISPQLVYLAVGLTPGSGIFGGRDLLQNDPKNTEFKGQAKLSAGAINGVRGASYLSMVVYDFNYNRLERRYPVSVTGPTNTAPIGAFTDSKATAFTFGHKRDYFGNPTPSAAPVEDSQLWVDLNWTFTDNVGGNPTGFRIWKSEDGANYRLAKTVAGNQSLVRDNDPGLKVGQKVYYKVEAYTSQGNSISKVMSTTPLDVFKLSNFTPGNRTRDVSVKPDIRWTVDKKVGDYRAFYVAVNDYPSQSSNCFWGNVICDGTTTDNLFTDKAGEGNKLSVQGNAYSLPFNANGTALKDTLEAYHSYTLDISAAAFSADGSAVSIAQDYNSVFYNLAGCNFGGPVCEGELSTFTTGDGSK